jgi:hypothetical protein
MIAKASAGASAGDVSLPKLELKKFKTAAFTSRETLCFSADVYLDGVLVGHAENDGQGGSTIVRPAPTAPARARWNAFEASVKKLPPVKDDDIELNGKPFEYRKTAEDLVDDAAYRVTRAKTLTRLLKGKLLIKTGPDEFRTLKARDPAELTSKTLRLAMQKKYPGCIFLNDLPFEEALDLYGKFEGGA